MELGGYIAKCSLKILCPRPLKNAYFQLGVLWITSYLFITTKNQMVCSFVTVKHKIFRNFRCLDIAFWYSSKDASEMYTVIPPVVVMKICQRYFKLFMMPNHLVGWNFGRKIQFFLLNLSGISVRIHKDIYGDILLHSIRKSVRNSNLSFF